MKRTRFLVRLDGGGQGEVKLHQETTLKIINAQKMHPWQSKYIHLAFCLSPPLCGAEKTKL